MPYAGDLLTAVRGFYLDLAQWAVEDPARRALWAVPCPIRATELVVHSKEKRHRKSRMDSAPANDFPSFPCWSAMSMSNARRQQRSCKPSPRHVPVTA